MKKYTYVSCLSCGRTINGVEAHDEENPETLFCVKCRDDNGGVKSYDAILEIVTCDIQKDCKCGYGEARARAIDRLNRMPFWKTHGADLGLASVME